MRLLLDENLPKKLKQDLSDYEVFTVKERGWNGVKNGELLQLMTEHGLDVLVTFDKNLEHQQNFKKHPITVLVLIAETNQYKHLQPLVGSIMERLETLVPGVTVIS